MFKQSQFRAVSIGIVATNKNRDTNIIKVTPIEILTDVQDDINDGTDTVTTQGIDNNKDLIKISITRGIAIEADWLGENYIHTSPDVRRGEQVIIYQSGDTDKYYWSSMGRDLNLRRLETLVWGISADPKNDDTEMSRENSYVYEVSSHDQHVTFSTSNKNGESATYISQYNLKEGIYSLEDNHGNFWYLDSVEKDFHFKNGDGSYYRMNKHTFDCYARDSISFKTKDFSVDSESTLIKSKKYTNKTSTYSLDSGTVSVKGTATFSDAVTFNSQTTHPTIMTTGITWAWHKGP